MKYTPIQFNSTRRINPGAYSIAAQNLTKALNNIYEINRKTAPDFSKLAQTQMDINAALGVANIQAQSQITTAGIKTLGELQQKKEILKGQEALRQGKRAGRLMLYGGGAIAQGIKMATRKPIEKPEPIYGVETPFNYPDSPYKPQLDGVQTNGLGPAPVMPGQSNFNPGAMDTPPAIPNFDTPPAEVRPAPQTQNTSGSGERYNVSQLTQFALDAGFPAEIAPTMGRIAMGESSGNPRAFNGKGSDQSYGLMQINMLGDMGPERRAKFGLTSNEDLFDPVTNFRVAKGIYDSQGLGAWGAYTNGSWQNY